MKLNKTDPNNFITDESISLEEALVEQRPLPPWRKKLMNDLKGNRNSTNFRMPGVNAPTKEPESNGIVVPKKSNPRKWLKIVLVPLLLIHWLAVLIHNLVDVVCDSVQEIILTLENFIRSDAQTEPNGVTPGE